MAYQLVVFTRYPTLTSAGMVVVGLAAGWLFLQILLMLHHIASRAKVISGCLNKLQGSTYRTFTVRECFASDEETYEDIDKWFVKSWFRFYGIRNLNISIDHLVHIHVVESPACLATLASYPLALFESHIFVHDTPEETKGLRRFYLLHEVGHTQLRIATFDLGMLAGVKHYLFYLCWVGLTVAWGGDVFVVLLSMVLAMVALYKENHRRMESVRLVDEVVADGFALGYLSKENLKLLAKNKYFPDILRDDDMSPLFNAIRLAKLKEHLALARDGWDDELIERTFEMLPTPALTTLTAMVLLAALPGLYAAAPTLWTLLWFLILDAALLLAFLISFVVSNMMNSVIGSMIRTSASPSR